MSNAKRVASQLRRAAGSAARRRSVGDYDPKAWLTEIGLRRYQPGPWSTGRWDEAYDSGALAYFGRLSERARFAVCADYLLFVMDECGWEPGETSVLDIGCGDGVLYRRCRHLGVGNWTGVDLSSAAIDQARSLANVVDVDGGPRFLVGDALQLGPWYDRQYDVVIISEVLNMCDSPADLLDRVADCLAPDGRVVVSSWRHRGDRQLQSLLGDRFGSLHHVDLRPARHDLAPRGWRVSLHAGGR